jgi:hypothetical protein
MLLQEINKVQPAQASPSKRQEHANHALPTHAHGMLLITLVEISPVRKITTEMLISKISSMEPTTALILLMFAELMQLTQKPPLLPPPELTVSTLSQTKETSLLVGKRHPPRYQVTTSALQHSHSLTTKMTSS